MTHLLESHEPKGLLPAPSKMTEIDHKTYRITKDASVVVDRWEDTQTRSEELTETTWDKLTAEDGVQKERLASRVTSRIFIDKAGNKVGYPVEGYVLNSNNPHRFESHVTADPEGNTLIVVDFYEITRSGSLFEMATASTDERPVKQFISKDCAFDYLDKPTTRRVITLNKDQLPERVVDSQIVEDTHTFFALEVPYYGVKHIYDETGRYHQAEATYTFNDLDSAQPGSARETELRVMYPGNYGSTITCEYHHDANTGKMKLNTVSDNFGNALWIMGKKSHHMPTGAIDYDVLSALFQRVSFVAGPGTEGGNTLNNVSILKEPQPFHEGQPLYYGEGITPLSTQQQKEQVLPKLKALLLQYPDAVVDIAAMAIPSPDAPDFLRSLNLSFTERIRTGIMMMKSSF